MAFTFDSTDKVTTLLTAHSAERSYYIKFYKTGAGGGSEGRPFFKGTSSAASVDFLTVDGSTLKYSRSFSTTAGQWTIVTPSEDVWHDILIVYDDSNVANNPVIYIDGSSVTVTEISTPVGTADTDAEAYVVGNRGVDGLRNWAGQLAEWATWDGLLTSDDATMLTSGMSPIMVRPDLLSSHAPMLRESIDTVLGTVTSVGVTVTDHPLIYIPSGQTHTPIQGAALVGEFFSGSFLSKNLWWGNY